MAALMDYLKHNFKIEPVDKRLSISVEFLVTKPPEMAARSRMPGTILR
jgi:hypothetical protein